MRTSQLHPWEHPESFGNPTLHMGPRYEMNCVEITVIVVVTVVVVVAVAETVDVGVVVLYHGYHIN